MATCVTDAAREAEQPWKTLASIEQVIAALQYLGRTHDEEIQSLRIEVSELAAEKDVLERKLATNSDEMVVENLTAQALPNMPELSLPGAVVCETSEISSQPGSKSTPIIPEMIMKNDHRLAVAPIELETQCESRAVPDSCKNKLPHLELKSVWHDHELDGLDNSHDKRVTPGRRLRRANTNALVWLVKKRETAELLEKDAEKVQMTSKAPLSRFIAVPGGSTRLAWDLFGGFLILFDLVSIPLNVFEPDPHWFTDFMDTLTLLFWTANIGATLTVGYNDKGKLIMSPWLIFIRYLKTWFIIDLVVVGPDWFFTFLALGLAGSASSGDGDSSEESVKLLRILRLSRTVRLLRLLKLKWILEMINDLLDSEWASIVANICKMIVLLLAINHFIACAWFAVGSISRDQKMNSWIVEHGFSEVPWNYQYITSFHWSITQFTPASMNIQPQNALERTFAIIVVIFALVGFSYVVGSISGSLTQLRNMSEVASKEFWKLRRFLRKNNIPLSLSYRIRKFSEYEYKKKKARMPLSEVSMLNLLSEQLTYELYCELNYEYINIHPFFTTVASEALSTIQKFCYKGLQEKQLAPEEIIFPPGVASKAMYFTKSGTFSYALTNEFDEPQMDELLDARSAWFSEASLWAQEWKHVGMLTALKEAEIILIGVDVFVDTVKTDEIALVLAREYAIGFIDVLSKKGSDVSDLMKVTECSELEGLLPEPLHVTSQGTGSTVNPVAQATQAGAGLLRRLMNSSGFAGPTPKRRSSLRSTLSSKS